MTKKAERMTRAGLPKATDKGRKMAQEGMKPFLPAFQHAADEETEKDFGIKPGSLPRRVKSIRRAKPRKKK